MSHVIELWADRVIRDGAAAPLNPTSPVKVAFDGSKGFSVGGNNKPTTYLGISRIRFLTNAGLEQLPNLSLATIPDLYSREWPDGAKLAFAPDADPHRSNVRLFQLCALQTSTLHFTNVDSGSALASWGTNLGHWLGFKLRLCDPAMLDHPQPFDSLTATEVFRSATAGVDSANWVRESDFRAIQAAAEMREAAGRRSPYIAGGLVVWKGRTKAWLDSFAANSAAAPVVGAVVGPDHKGASRDDDVAENQIKASSDGFWWWKNQRAESDNNLKTIGDAFDKLRTGKFRARREAAGIEVATQLEVLDLLGLTAKAATAAPTSAQPIHCLDAAPLGRAIVLNRWLFVANGAGEDAPGRAVELTVESPTWDAANTFKSRVILHDLTDAQFCTIWERKIAGPLRAAAMAEASSSGVSLLPRFDGATGTGKWSVTIDLDAPNSLPDNRGFLTRYPIKEIKLKQSSGMVSATAIDFPGLLTHSGTGGLIANGSFRIELNSTISLKVDSAGRFALAEDLDMTVTATEDIKASGMIAAIGGLDLHFGEGEFSPFKVHWPELASGRDYSVRELALPLAKVSVGGADIGDKTPQRQPMIWNDGLMGGGAVALNDNRSSVGDRVVTANLKPAIADGHGRNQVTITTVDPAPMLVAQVSIARLTAPTQTRESMVTWQSSEGLWRITPVDDRPQEVRLTLPPQGVAEAWERTDWYLPPDQVEDKKRVPARLTPNTELRLEADERTRNAVAPWNLRELLGFTDADLPGTRLLELVRNEVLYGLEASAGPISGMRLAEIAAWRGVPAESRGKHEGRRMWWDTGLATFATRLAVLDLRDERDLSLRPKITDARFKLRSAEEGGKYVQPYIGQPADSDWTAASKGGILGGALAGFEQKSLVDKLPGLPDGKGEIDGLQLSALGAWTTPRSQFQNGLTRISAEAAMGRIGEARFERLGRIGMLHHPAKHVIVYRRAFLPSRQFAGARSESKNEGRPIVRKVEEYVELTQPLRNYPDRLRATAKDNGPVLGARFRTVRIPVSGGWAEPIADVRVAGYSLPLWREGADPGIYPKPVIELLFAGDPARSEPEPIARRIATPHRLRFYTLTEVGAREPSGDVETWPLVYGLDLVDRATDSPLNGGPIGSDDFADTSPDLAEAPGLEAYTLALEPGLPINVSQARSDKPTMADLRTVLMLRARQPGATSKDASHLGSVQKAQGELAILARLVTENPDQDGATVARKAVDQIAKLKEALAKVKVEEWSAKACDWAHAPERAIDEVIALLGKESDALHARLKTLWTTNKDNAANQIRLAKRTVGSLLPLDTSLAKLLRPVLDQVKLTEATIVRELDAGWDQADGRIDLIEKTMVKALDGMLEQLGALQDVINAGDAQAVRALAEFEAKIEPFARQAMTTLGQVRANLQKFDGIAAQLRKHAEKLAKSSPMAASELQHVAEMLLAVRGKIESLAKKAKAELPGTLDKVRSRIEIWKVRGEEAKEAALTAVKVVKVLTEIVKDDLTGAIAGLLRDSRQLRGQVKEKIASAATEAGALANGIGAEPLGEIEANLRKVIEALDQLHKAIDQAAPPSEPFDLLAELHGALLEELENLKSECNEAGGKICSKLDEWGAEDLATKLLKNWSQELNKISNTIGEIEDLAELAKEIVKNAAALGLALGQVRQGVEQMLDGKIARRLLEGEVAPNGLGEAVGLKLLRAAGAPPIVEQLVFNREQIAYHFENEANRVIVTPVKAFVDQAERALRGVGLELPMLGIGDTLLSPVHDAFDDLRKDGQEVLADLKLKAKDVLKDFAGLKELLPNLNYDSKLARAIKVTHDYDAKRAVAWLEARIDFGPETQDLFRHSAFAVIAEKMRITGVSRYERGLNGGEGRKVQAELISDWVLVIGGMALVRIRDAAIRFNGKGLKFDIRPEKIEFPGALQLLTQALSQISVGENPLAIEILNDPGSGLPIGLRSSYDLPPTSFGIGVVSVMNAALGVRIELAQRAEFEIVAAAYFGREDRPFAMTVSFLGGGGYVEARAIHVPALKRTDLELAVSIGLAAGTGFAFGPIKGSIQVYVGFEARFRSGSAGSQIAISVLFVLSGSVTVWGFVTVNLGVRLALTYDGRKMLGHGNIEIEVRISRFYKKRFSRSITYKLT